jgi:hypothetical protein
MSGAVQHEAGREMVNLDWGKSESEIRNSKLETRNRKAEAFFRASGLSRIDEFGHVTECRLNLFLG